MEQNTAIQYKAVNDSSYNELAAYVVDIVANVSLFPGHRTIVVDGKAANDVGKFIDDKGLDFHINPIEVCDENFCEVIDNETTDPGTLRNIIYRILKQKRYMAEQHESVVAEIAKAREKAEKDRDVYFRLYSECNSRANRVKSQVQAIALLMNEIYPQK